MEIWNHFELSIDKNKSLTEIRKFTHLKSLVLGAASNTIKGFSLTENNYTLKKRHGRHDNLVHDHLSNLLNMKGLNSSSDTTGLRNLYDACLVKIRSLKSLDAKLIHTMSYFQYYQS